MSSYATLCTTFDLSYFLFAKFGPTSTLIMRLQWALDASQALASRPRASCLRSFDMPRSQVDVAGGLFVNDAVCAFCSAACTSQFALAFFLDKFIVTRGVVK